MYCMKSELDLFEKPALENNILGTEGLSYQPLNSLDSSSDTIEFMLPGSGEHYKDLSSLYLRLLVQVDQVNTKKMPVTGTSNTGNITSTEEELPDVSIANNTLHSIFRGVSVFFNGTLVSQDTLYNYKAYIQTVINYGSDAAKTHLGMAGFTLDKTPEAGSDVRAAIYSKKKSLELLGKLNVDIFNQPRFLLNNVDIKIVLTKEKSAFLFETDEPLTNPSLKILEANILVDQIKLNPSLLLAHNRILEKSNALYPFKRVETRVFTVNAGSHNILLDNLIFGQLPNVLLFALVSNSQFNGSYGTNPFHFDNYGSESFSLYVNGNQIKHLKMNPSASTDTTANPLTTSAYYSLFKASGTRFSNQGSIITRGKFDFNGYFMIPVDLTADGCHNSGLINPIRQGTIRIEGKFKTPLKEGVFDHF